MDNIKKPAADAIKLPEGMVITPVDKHNLLEKILENTYTLDMLKKRVKALRHKVNIELFNLKVDPKREDHEYDAWINSLGKDFAKVFTRDDFQQAFEELDKQVSELQPLVIYFSYDPGPSQIILIGGWLRQNLGKNFVFDIKLDYSLIGGCAFVWKGIYKDYSVRAKIAQNKEIILESFRNFLKQKQV